MLLVMLSTRGPIEAAGTHKTARQARELAAPLMMKARQVR